ncbi:unnamed protein product [Effrenium voratum]|nr:unnamed protein product [Effrenium voratum]
MGRQVHGACGSCGAADHPGSERRLGSLCLALCGSAAAAAFDHLLKTWIFARLTKINWQHRVWANISSDPCEDSPTFAHFQIRIRANEEISISKVGDSQPKVVCKPKLEGCCICMDEEPECKALLPCGHVFCEDCIAHWAVSGSKESHTCPVCRSPFDLQVV